MVWYFMDVYIINRTVHGRAEIQNFSSSVEKYFTRSLCSLVKYFSTLDVSISVQPCNILYLMNEAEYLLKNYGDRRGCRGRRPRQITPSEISIILHKIRKPNSIIVLLFILSNSLFKNIAKTCLPLSIH